MKYLLLLLFVSPTASSQGFNLPMPDMDRIKSVMEADPREDAIYIYLKQNFKPVTEKFDIKGYSDTDAPEICSFRQNFEQGITYSEDYCSESGVVYEVMLPKADLISLKKWIEEMYAISGTEIENVWDKSGLIYTAPQTKVQAAIMKLNLEKIKLFSLCTVAAKWHDMLQQAQQTLTRPQLIASQGFLAQFLQYLYHN